MTDTGEGPTRRSVLRAVGAIGAATTGPPVAAAATDGNEGRPSGTESTVEPEDGVVHVRNDGMSLAVRLDPFGVRFAGRRGEGPTGFAEADLGPGRVTPFEGEPGTAAGAVEGTAGGRYGTLGSAVGVAGRRTRRWRPGPRRPMRISAGYTPRG